MAQCSLLIITFVSPHSDNPLSLFCMVLVEFFTGLPCIISQRDMVWHSIVILKWRRKLFSQTPENTRDMSSLFGMSQESSPVSLRSEGVERGQGMEHSWEICVYTTWPCEKKGNFPQFIKCNPIFLPDQLLLKGKEAIPPSYIPASVYTGSLYNPSMPLILLTL